MIPIILITGFLGSGKTTFINWLLAQNPNAKISLILNEFGEVKLESFFVKQHAENIAELANGCMCCVAKSDIPRVVAYILEHSPQTEFIVIEASGLSDPDPVREALQAPPVNQSAYLESTICIVDAVNFEQLRGQHAIMTSQIADADLLVLSKIAEAGSEQTQRVTTQLQALTPEVRVIPFTENLSPQIFLTKVGPARLSETDHEQAHPHTHEQYHVFLYETSTALEVNQLQTYLKQLPPEILRIKGVVKCVSEEGESFLVRVQRVGAHFTIEEIAPVGPAENPSNASQPNETANTTILFIGQNFDQTALYSHLETLKLQ